MPQLATNQKAILKKMAFVIFDPGKFLSSKKLKTESKVKHIEY